MKEPVKLLSPCKKHKPKELGYLQWAQWANKMERMGKKQTQCPICKRWYFKSEM
mgnify:CR=1 FL=1